MRNQLLTLRSALLLLGAVFFASATQSEANNTITNTISLSQLPKNTNERNGYTEEYEHDFELHGILYRIISPNEVAVATGNYNGDESVDFSDISYAAELGFSGGHVVIPETISYNGKSYNVTRLDVWSFWGVGYNISSITLPSTIKTISSAAFGLGSRDKKLDYIICNALTPPSLTGDPFEYCPPEVTDETVLYVPSSSINAYNNSNGWKDFHSIKSIDDFEDSRDCFVIDGITYEVLGSNQVGVTYSTNNSYSGSVVIPSLVTYQGTTYEVKKIREQAFSHVNMSSLTIPSSIESVENYAFEGSIISYLNILDGDRLEFVSSMINVDINRLYLGRDCSYQSNNSYYHTSFFSKNLKQVDIGNLVTTIGNDAFYGCTELTNVTIGSAVTSIGNSAFSGCGNINELTWNAKRCSSNGNMTTANIDRVSIGEDVEVLPSYFVQNSKITEVTIPNAVTSIGSSAFSGCTGLTTINIQNSVIGSSMFRGCTGLTDITIPNTVTSIGDYAFEGCTGLNSITIPNSVTSIGIYAFFGCSGLESVYCWALEPPRLGYSAFNGVPSNMRVYVPAIAVETYESASGWNQFEILPIVDSHVLSVSLPENVNVQDYSNMRLETTDAESGNVQHYTLTDKSSYQFTVVPNSTWNVTLTNQYGDLFGKIEHVEVGEEDIEVLFPSLLTPQDVSIKVKKPNGQEVTALCKISWFDEDGELLLQGNPIKKLPTGRKLKYQVTLPQDLATAFTLPSTSTHTVKDGNNEISCQLSAIGEAQLSGRVKDATNNQSLYGATISAVQSFGGGTTQTITARTDNQGQYLLDVSTVPTTLTIAATGYISKTIDCDMTSGGSTVTVPDVALSPITGAVVNINLTYTPAHAEGEADETQNWYSDYSNVDYEVYNITTGHAITDISVQYPQIVLIEDVGDGDVLELTATSRKNAFKPVKTTVTIAEQKANATFNIKELGKVTATFNRNINPKVTGLLYDAEKKLVKTADYSGSTQTIEELPDGNYTLVTMGKSDFFNSIYDLDMFASAGLSEDDDYVKNDVQVNSGIISLVSIDEVPFFDESKFYYTGEQTSFSVNKPDIVVGNYLTFRAQLDFKEQYANQVNDVQLIVDLPESCTFIDNSVMAGANMAVYSTSGNRITIPLAYWNEVIIRLCAIPTLPGDFAPNAFVRFKLNGKTITQPIGNAIFHVENISSIIVPPRSASTVISVGGTALNKCQIDIYDNDVLIGHTTSMANSKWLTTCELYNPYNLSRHNIYAIITTDQGVQVPTETATCIYDKNEPQVSKVTQYNEQRGPTPYIVIWDFLNPSLSTQHYSYDMYDNHRTFSYTIEFTDNKAVSNVVLYVKTAKTGWWPLDATYDEEKDVWVTAGEFGDSQNADLPINVGVNFTTIINEINIENLAYALANALDHHSDNDPDIPEIDGDQYTITQSQGNTVFDFDGLFIDGKWLKSVVAGDDISIEYISEGIEESITMSYGGVNALPQDAYEYKLNNTQSLFVTNTSGDFTTEVCYYFPVSVINSLLNAPYSQQSHRFDFFNLILEKAGSAAYAYVNQSLTLKRNMPNRATEPMDPLDEVLMNCPELEPMVNEMRWRQQHSAQLNDALDRFRDIAEWVSRVLQRIGGLGEPAADALDVGNQAVETGQRIGNYQNSLHDENYWAQFRAAGCAPRNHPPRPSHRYPGADMTFCIDPSGFVYEGVPSNRLQGVTATCYYKETVEDMYGDPIENVVLWDAENYGQENPLITDVNGYYRWDVPIGMWQVKYEKEGYETTYSDWLPVPPPQLDVNIGMVQMRQPEVIKARAYPKAVEFEFDKFMYPETLNSNNITVTVNGSPVSGTIELLNAEVDDPLAITSIRRAPGTGLTFASKVRFNANSPFNADKVTLHVKKDVKSYADLEMYEDYEAVLDVELEIQSIEADSTVNILYGDSRELTVTVLPANASRGKTLSVRSVAPMITTTDAETYTLNNNGQAIITVHGDLPGMTSLLYSIDGYDLTASTLVNVMSESQMTVATPTASIASGSVVEKGTAVYLSCSTEGATIYYTLDGSCPCDNTPARKVYDGTPIIINSTTTIKAMATAPDLYDSDVATFVYRVPNGLRGDVNGDGEVNIADVNALLDIVLGGQVDEDTRARADVNADDEVNIADINAVIELILNPSNHVMNKVNCNDLLHIDDVTIKPGDIKTINVTIDNASRYSAMQCDIALPAGLTLVDILSVNGHINKTDELDENTMRAVNYSMDKRSYSGDGSPVMSLTVLADADLGTESEIKLTNVVLADAANKAWRVEDCTARISNTTGINDLTASIDRVWVEGNTLCIETRQDGVASIAAINGVTYDLDVKAGVNRYVLDAGLYVVVINGKGHKIAVK